MEISSILLILSAIFNTIIGSFVLLKGDKGKTKILYSFLAINIVLWSVSILFFRILSNPVLVDIWSRIAHFAAAGIGLSLVCFTIHFPFVRSKKTNKALYFFLVLPFIYIVYLLINTNEIVGSFVNLNGQNYYQIGGFYITYISFIALYFTISFIELGLKFFQSQGINKAQTGFIFWGMFISTVPGLVTNLIFPAMGIIKYNWIGPTGTFVMIISFGYAILKLRLMNIKVITTELFSILIAILLLIDALISKTLTEFILKFGLFLAVSFFSYLLIRSVMAEIKAKEQLAKLSKDLKKANIELKKLDQTKSEFLSIASHQLRTPLTVIKGYSSMILEGDYGKVPDKMKAIIDRIFQSSNRLVSMVEDFLNISRIEMGRMKYDIVQFDLKETTENIVKDFNINNKKARVLELDFSAENEEFDIKGDQNKIRQVISNMIDNALKYTENGFVKVNLSHSDLGKVLIKIQDSGAGIAKESLKEIFGKFNRAQQISKEHVDGSGLGLYVAKRIVNDHHGKIWAESEGRGKGSTFFMELPNRLDNINKKDYK